MDYKCSSVCKKNTQTLTKDLDLLSQPKQSSAFCLLDLLCVMQMMCVQIKKRDRAHIWNTMAICEDEPWAGKICANSTWIDWVQKSEKTHDSHCEIGVAAIRKSDGSVQRTMTAIDSFTNPFSVEPSKLVNCSSGAAVPPEVEKMYYMQIK